MMLGMGVMLIVGTFKCLTDSMYFRARVNLRLRVSPDRKRASSLGTAHVGLPGRELRLPFNSPSA